jgi:hypothetical protein
MINYEWKIPNMTVFRQLDGKENVVNIVNWYLIGTNEDGINGFINGSFVKEYDSNSEFVNYEDLTKEVVEQWILDVLDEQTIDAYKQSIIQQIEEKIAPVIVNKAAPWTI